MKKLLALMSIVLLLAFAAAFAAGGSASDPLATKSYVDGIFAQLTETAVARAAEFSQLAAPSVGKLDALNNLTVATTSEELAAQVTYEGYIRYLEAGYAFTANTPVVVTIKTGERLMVSPGSEFRLVSGTATLDGARAAEIIDTTAGGQNYAGMSAARGTRYVLASEHMAGLHATSEARISVLGSYQIVPVMRPRHTAAAIELQLRGLMRGSNLGFELNRKATRLEGLIMFLRLIGEEQAALDFTGSHPFTDVPVWAGDTANKYVAYAYSKGYTNGVSATRFGAKDSITAEQYMTFVLRALGYRDGTDFEWMRSLDAAVAVGIITPADKANTDRIGFYRDTMAYLSLLAIQ